MDVNDRKFISKTDSTKYFSWGHTIGKNKNGVGSYSFSRDNYNAGLCGSGHTLKGDIPQGNVAYDAATANMGSPWKMPTKEQCQELIDNTTSTWTTINGVNGRAFYNKTNPSKYIFFPTAGMFLDTNYQEVGIRGRYWLVTNAARENANNGYQMLIGDSINSISSDHRWYGNSVRAIQ